MMWSLELPAQTPSSRSGWSLIACPGRQKGELYQLALLCTPGLTGQALPELRSTTWHACCPPIRWRPPEGMADSCSCWATLASPHMWVHASCAPIQVSAQEIAQGPTQDRMAAIASSIVGQRRSVSHCGLCMSDNELKHLIRVVVCDYHANHLDIKTLTAPVYSTALGQNLMCACLCAATTRCTRPPLGACLDTSLGQALDMPCTPDILLFPL